MDDSALKIPKKLMPVTLWVHPDGLVIGSMFLHLPGPDAPNGEQPADVLNESADFLAIKRDDPEDLRFYNKSAIVRVEYWDGAGKRDRKSTRLNSSHSQQSRMPSSA